jgi:serine/threonine protein kinase
MGTPSVFETMSATYRRGASIGQGGAGVVFEVTDDAGQTFALKWLKPANADQEKAKRFRSEIAFCLRPPHSRILRIIDSGFVFIDGKKAPFYVMKRYAGTLRTLMKNGIPREKAIAYFEQVLDTVEAIHLLKSSHRDLKPENILYDDETDSLFLADFGIAHFHEDLLFTAVETNPNSRLANFEYAAPEQRRKGGHVGPPADIFALGLILNELFTGEIPWGEDYKTIESVWPDMAELDRAVRSMRTQDPSRRPSTAEIRGALTGQRNILDSRQRLSRTTGDVVPAATVDDDPLIANPVQLVGIDPQTDFIILELYPKPDNKWISIFRMLRVSTIPRPGIGPNEVEYYPHKGSAVIKATDITQEYINTFKSWVASTNEQYRAKMRKEVEEEEGRRTEQLRKSREAERRRIDILRRIKV